MKICILKLPYKKKKKSICFFMEPFERHQFKKLQI